MSVRLVGLVGLLALAGAGFTAQPPAPRAAGLAPATDLTAKPPLSPRNASYNISARLDPSTRMLTGSEVLTWRNPSSRPATTLQFHLYYNAWRNTQSTWMREGRRRGESGTNPRRAADWGWIDITSLRLTGPGFDTAELASRLRFIAPDDGNLGDRTLVELPLDRPVAPGESLNVRMEWSSHVPRPFARTGVIGDSYFLAQWFPKIGVLEDDGWNTHQFHAATEFFSDFGVYDVQLTVPTGWVVGATGVERDRTDGSDGTTTHRYYQEDVHDFAWTTSPDYLERRARFEHPTLPAVTIRLLLQPEHAGQLDRHVDAVRATLKHYGEWFGAYPYTHLTVVDPAWQSGAGGMEYPTLITAGSTWIAPRGVTTPEEVTMHEAGHQWWYGVVATNEFEHAWMDEGINTYATARAIAQAYTPSYFAKFYFGGFVPWVFTDVPFTRIDYDRLASYRSAATADVAATPSFRYWPATAGAITYSKTALWMHTLERMVGWETQQRILSTYYSRWAFRHPKPEDFFAVVNEVSGRDLTWFFDQVHRGSNVFDYGVELLRSEPAIEDGVPSDAASGTELRVLPYRTTVVVRRYGEAVFPVDIRVRFADNTEQRWHWDGRDRWKQFEIDRPVAATVAEVDPERVLVLDVNVTNNSATLAPKGPAAARRWSLAWLIWLQDHLLTYGFFV